LQTEANTNCLVFVFAQAVRGLSGMDNCVFWLNITAQLLRTSDLLRRISDKETPNQVCTTTMIQGNRRIIIFH